MRALIQRVSEAEVTVEGKSTGKIGTGLLVFIGINQTDGEAEISKLIRKILQLRIFNDEAGKMNLSVTEVNGEILLVSQFTLYADCRKGNRPSYTDAASPTRALNTYLNFTSCFRESTLLKIEEGIFGADMKVRLLNDGPVTIFLDTDHL